MAKQRRDGLTFGQRLAMIVCTALVALVLVAGASYGLWRVICQVGHGVLAAWALVATVAVPVAVWAGVRIGNVENRGMLAGLTQGADAVVNTANKVADVKVRAVHRVRNATQPAPAPYTVIEEPPLLLTGRGDDGRYLDA